MADINKLRPKTKQLAQMLIDECKKQGIDIVLIETFRSTETQDAYYAQGRLPLSEVNALRKVAGLQPISEYVNEKKITNARSGESAHNYGLAFDICPKVNGKLAWNRIDLFDKIGKIASTLVVDGVYKLVWGGNFKSISDKPHFEMENWKKYI